MIYVSTDFGFLETKTHFHTTSNYQHMQIVGGQQILNDLILKETPQEKEDPRI